MLPETIETAPTGSAGAAIGQAKYPIKTAPIAADAAIRNFIIKDNSIALIPQVPPYG
jgi:hypothetical protein